MAYNPVINGLRLGSLVQVDGNMGQLVNYHKNENEVEVAMIKDGERVRVAPEKASAPKSLQTPGKGGGSDSFDVVQGPCTPEAALGEEVSMCLFEKGFCVVKLCQPSKDMTELMDAAAEWQDSGEFYRLPEVVEEGYLGTGVTGKVMWIDPMDQPEPRSQVLATCDSNMSYLAGALQPYCQDSLGGAIAERTPSMLYLSFLKDEEDEYLPATADDAALGDFLGTYRRQLVRVVHFMGPDSATVTLERQPSDTADKMPFLEQSVSINATTNTILVYRPSCWDYGYRNPASKVNMTLSASFLKASPELDFVAVEPEGLESLVMKPILGKACPSGSNHTNITQIGTRLGGRYDWYECYNTGMLGGMDTVVKIPFVRYNVDLYYDPDLNNSRCTRHTSFVDGVEWFDNKYFEIDQNTAKVMGPLQRQCMEVAGQLMCLEGIPKRVANKTPHHSGVAVGLDKDDFAAMMDKGQIGAGNNVIAIISNRISFAFNLKGANYVADTACSASLTSTHFARVCMTYNSTIDPLDFFLSLGSHLVLNMRMELPGGPAMHSFVGRCFTFDKTADGYLPGEGHTGIMLKQGLLPEERLSIMGASQVGQNGRSATLTAPNGPAQESVCVKAITELKITAAESTTWDCHGTGTSLGDPIEVGAVRRIQNKGGREDCLIVTTAKTYLGHLEGGAAMTAMIKSICQSKSGHCLPILHLFQLNPHLEHEQFNAGFFNEMVGYDECPNAFCHVSSFGFGGTNGHAIFWGTDIVHSSRKVPDVTTSLLKFINKAPPPEVRPIGKNPADWGSDYPDAKCEAGDKYIITFGDGGVADGPLKFVKDTVGGDDGSGFYSITGNFNDWGDDPMVDGLVPGSYTRVVEMPKSGILEFRFFSNGDQDSAFTPSVRRCTKRGAGIEGPMPAEDASCWLVRGRPGADLVIELFMVKGKRSILWYFLGDETES